MSITYTTCWPNISPTAAIGTAMRSCSRLTFFDIERAHCIFRGAANTHFLLLFTPRAGLNLCTSSRKACNGFRMWSHCSRRLPARLRSKGTACSAFRCWSDCESVPRNDNVSWKSDEAPPESCSAVVTWCTNFRAEMMSPADHPKDIASKFCGISESKETTRGLKTWDGWTWRSWWGEWGSLVHGRLCLLSHTRTSPLTSVFPTATSVHQVEA